MKTVRLTLLLIIISFNFSNLNAQLPWLHVEGNQIKDATGNPVTLRGVSVLAPEHNNECNSCASKPIAEMIAWQADASRGWNSRVVRLQVTTAKVTDPEASFKTIIDPYVQLAVSKGLYVIVDLHFVSDYGATGIPQSYVLNFWKYVAPKYANNPNVIFELFNEPINPDNWTTWKNYIQPVVNVVRAAAPNNLVLIGGPQWSTRVNSAVTDPVIGSNLVYVYHIYPNQGAASTANLDTKFGTAAQTIPIMITEFGWNQNASYSDGVTMGTTSQWGQPFRTYIDSRPQISWTSYIFDNYWKPQYFNAGWNMMDGENQGQFMQQWFTDKKDDHQPQPATLTANAVNSTVINLRWPPVAGAISYNLKRSASSGGPYTTIAAGITTQTYTDVALTPQTAYYYVVSAVTAGGEGADSPQAAATTEASGFAPDVPMLPTATGSNGQVVLGWRASIGASSYKINRSTVSGGPYVTVASNVAAITYTDAAVTNGTRYYYTITAVGGQESSPTAEVSEIPSSEVLIVDNVNALTTGAWTTGTASPGFYGSNYLHDGNSGAVGGKSVRYTPTIIKPGIYNVAVRWAASSNRAANIPVDINHYNGAVADTISQQGNGALWISLGNFSFNAGTSGNVLLRNDGADGFVIADAVKFALVEEVEMPTSIHVQSIVTSAVNMGFLKKKGQAVVTVADNLGTPVAGVTVDGNFCCSFTQAVNNVTDADGKITFQTTATAVGPVNVSFCVTNLSHSSLSYAFPDNITTCADTLSIFSIPSWASLSVYPNPASNRLLVSSIPPGTTHVFVFDLQGRKLIEKAVSSKGLSEIDISRLKPGSYMVQAVGDSKSQLIFIKQ